VRFERERGAVRLRGRASTAGRPGPPLAGRASGFRPAVRDVPPYGHGLTTQAPCLVPRAHPAMPPAINPTDYKILNFPLAIPRPFGVQYTRRKKGRVVFAGAGTVPLS